MEQHEPIFLPVGHIVDPEDLHDPIGFLRLQHEEQRGFCRRLNALVDDLGAEQGAAEASCLLDFLLGEMASNMVAEETTLVPLLYDRCDREDLLAAMVKDSLNAHTLIGLLLPEVGCGLRCLANSEVPGRPLEFISSALEFADHVERHVDREDLTLLPLARFRLTTEDYIWLGQTLARQHGLPYPSGWEPEAPAVRVRSPADAQTAIPDRSPVPGLREARWRTAWRDRKAALFGRLH